MKKGKAERQKAGPDTKRSRREKLTLKDLTYPDHRVVQFPQVQGKTAEKIEVVTSPAFHAITLAFRDKTTLTFAIEPGFALKAAYQYFKRGKPQAKLWPEVKSST